MFEQSINERLIHKKKRIAVVTLALPGSPGKSGGEIRDSHILEYLALNNDVDIFSIHDFFLKDNSDNRYSSLISQCKNIYHPDKVGREHPDCIQNAEGKLSFSYRLRRKIANYDIYLPYSEYTLEAEGFMNVFNMYTRGILQKKLNEDNYDFLIVTPQVNPAFLANIVIPSTCRCIFATYDVEKVRYKRLRATRKTILGRLLFNFEINKAFKTEKRIIDKVDGVIAVSELDRNIFIKEYKILPDRVLNIENGVDTTYFSPLPKEGNSKDIVYIGNMGYAPNIQAVEYFIDDVFPIIIKEVPDVHLWIVGANASEDLKKLDNGNNITVTGEVPDVREYLKKADVVCFPLLAGSGTKYKVIEALSAEKAVVTTPIGAEGINLIDGEHLFIKNDKEGIANAVINCLMNPEIGRKLGRNGRDFVVKTHEWKVILPKIDKWLDYLLEEPILRVNR